MIQKFWASVTPSPSFLSGNSIYPSLIKVPPQCTIILPFLDERPTIAAHGQLPTVAGSPPTMRNPFEIPHSNVSGFCVVGFWVGFGVGFEVGFEVGNVTGFLVVFWVVVVSVGFCVGFWVGLCVGFGAFLKWIIQFKYIYQVITF